MSEQAQFEWCECGSDGGGLTTVEKCVSDGQPAKHIYTYTQTNLLNTHSYLISSGNSLRQQSNIVVGMFSARLGPIERAICVLHAHAFHSLYGCWYNFFYFFRLLLLFLLPLRTCFIGLATQKDWILGARCAALTDWVISKLTKILFNDIDWIKEAREREEKWVVQIKENL